MQEWIHAHEALLWWLGSLSLVTIVGTLILIPVVVIRLPVNYFTRSRRSPAPWREQHPAWRLTALIAKNLLGGLFVLAGLAMLLLPGQGLLTILVGLVLLDFPGKFRLERALARRRSILRTLNWIRRKADRTPLHRPARVKGKGD